MLTCKSCIFKSTRFISSGLKSIISSGIKGENFIPFYLTRSEIACNDDKAAGVSPVLWKNQGNFRINYFLRSADIVKSNKNMVLPSLFKELKVLPTLKKCILEAPTFERRLILEKGDISSKAPITDPQHQNNAPMYAGVRMLVIRRKKMRKFKRKKRMNRDYFLLQKRHLKKKLKAESLFISRMQELRDDLDNFEPLSYVKDVIQRAEREWQVNVAPTGRKKYGHWSEVMSLEELYGLDNSNYINKRAGLITTPEDRAEFEEKRADYFRKYVQTNKTNKVVNNNEDEK